MDGGKLHLIQVTEQKYPNTKDIKPEDLKLALNKLSQDLSSAAQKAYTENLKVQAGDKIVVDPSIRSSQATDADL